MTRPRRKALSPWRTRQVNIRVAVLGGCIIATVGLITIGLLPNTAGALIPESASAPYIPSGPAPMPTASASIPAITPTAATDTLTPDPKPAVTKPAVKVPTTKKATTVAPKPAPKSTALAVTVNVTGSQAQVDLCKGPVLFVGAYIVQHASCGGKQFMSLTVGSTVVLKGSAVKNGTYKVVDVADMVNGTLNHPLPTQYALQTCLDGAGHMRFWYLQAV